MREVCGKKMRGNLLFISAVAPACMQSDLIITNNNDEIKQEGFAIIFFLWSKVSVFFCCFLWQKTIYTDCLLFTVNILPVILPYLPTKSILSNNFSILQLGVLFFLSQEVLTAWLNCLKNDNLLKLNNA